MSHRYPRRLVALGCLVLACVCCWAIAGRGPSPLPTSADEGDGYAHWLEGRSMLAQAGREARLISGTGEQWRHPYGEPQPREAVRAAPVWLLDYPGSVVPRPGRSVVATWADPALWDALQDLGVTLLHTGPVKRAGGVRGREFTPSTDGWFDPISLEVDPALGTDDEYRALV